jgi:hypothetical protein
MCLPFLTWVRCVCVCVCVRARWRLCDCCLTCRPHVPTTVCVLLTFLSEADAYLVAHLMLEQSRANRWYTT